MIKYFLVKSALSNAPDAYKAQVTDLPSYDIDDIIDLMMERGSSLTKGDAKLALEVFNETVKSLLRKGAAVRTPLFNAKPSIRGLFEHVEDSFDENRHRITMNLNPGAELLDVPAEISTTKCENTSWVPNITQVIDSNSGSISNSITAGGVIILTGSNLRFLTESTTDGVFLLPADGGEGIPLTTVVPPKPSQLIVALPHNLSIGAYFVEVRSLYSRGHRLTAQRKGRFKKQLTVG